ncbi:MAG: flippase, partial [Calditrichaeota bacterium]
MDKIPQRAEDMASSTETIRTGDSTVEKPLQSDVRRLGKGGGIALGGRLGGRALLVANQVILARALGPAEFGLFALGWTIIQMGSMILPLGLHQGIIRYGSQYWRVDNRRFRAVIQWSLGLASVLALSGALILFLASPWLAFEVFRKPDLVGVFRSFAPALALATILQVAAAGTRISQRMQFSALAGDIMPSAIRLVCVLLLVVLLHQGLKGAVFSAIAGFAIGMALAVFSLWKLFRQEFCSLLPVQAQTRLSIKELLAFSLSASLASTFVMLTIRVDRLLVGYFLPASEVGIYQAASQAAMLSAMIMGAFNAIFSPMSARLYHQGEIGRLNELYKVSTKWGLYISLPYFLVLLVAPRGVMAVMFGRPYVSGASPMLVMAGAQLFNAATGAVGILLIMSEYSRRRLMQAIVAFVINMLMCTLLIPPFGLLGAAWAVLVSVVVLFGWGLLDVRHQLGLWPYDERYGKGILATLAVLIILLVLKRLFSVFP